MLTKPRALLTSNAPFVKFHASAMLKLLKAPPTRKSRHVPPGMRNDFFAANALSRLAYNKMAESVEHFASVRMPSGEVKAWLETITGIVFFLALVL